MQNVRAISFLCICICIWYRGGKYYTINCNAFSNRRDNIMIPVSTLYSRVVYSLHLWRFQKRWYCDNGLVWPYRRLLSSCVLLLISNYCTYGSLSMHRLPILFSTHDMITCMLYIALLCAAFFAKFQIVGPECTTPKPLNSSGVREPTLHRAYDIRRKSW